MTVRDPRFADWLVGSLRNGLVAIDTTGAITALSAAAAPVLGCSGAPDERVLGRPCREVLADAPDVVALLEGVLDGRERPSRAELRLSRSGFAEPVTLGYTLVCVRDDAGDVRGAAMVFRDLTPFERMDEQERLAERLRALGQMAAGLAHEIRNPLASMEVLAGLLKRRLGPRPDELELVEDLQAEIRGLAATVTHALDFVRPVSVQPRRVDTRRLLDRAVERARARVAFDGVVERKVESGCKWLWADPERLQGALVNLVVNALEAMAEAPAPEGHVLRLVAASDVGGGVRLSVSDTGPGIPAEFRERIFHPFFTTREKGSGVGLAEVHKVAAAHRGSVDARPRPGGGTTFRICLPAGGPEVGP